MLNLQCSGVRVLAPRAWPLDEGVRQLLPQMQEHLINNPHMTVLLSPHLENRSNLLTNRFVRSLHAGLVRAHLFVIRPRPGQGALQQELLK